MKTPITFLFVAATAGISLGFGSHQWLYGMALFNALLCVGMALDREP